MSYKFADSLRTESRLNWFRRKDARGENTKISYGLEKDVRKAVCNKTKRKTKNEMAG